ncbi:hypothetical protein E4U23_001297, partial [Claviceps purpurea]
PSETPSQQERRRRLDRDDRNRGEAVSIALRPVYFVCYECRIPRPSPGARSCYYCTLSSPTPLERQVKWCSRGEHATTRESFLYREIEYESCLEHEEHLPPSTSVPKPDTLDGLSPDPLRVNVDDRAGTGKSYTVQLVSSRLETMQRSRIPTSPRRSPEQAVYLFATRASVFDVNYSRLREVNVPVLLLRARHSNPRHASISSKEFNDLTAELPLTIGARVMLTAKIWTEAGLVNGSRGYVVDVVWHADVTDPRTTLPVYVLIYFPKYTGSTLPCDIPGVPMPSKVVPMPSKVVLIFPCRRYRTQNTTRTSTDNQWREQFPLMTGSADSPPSRGAPYATNAGSTNALSSYVLYGASTGRRGRERDKEGTPTPWGR